MLRTKRKRCVCAIGALIFATTYAGAALSGSGGTVAERLPARSRSVPAAVRGGIASQSIQMKTIRTELLEVAYLDGGPQDVNRSCFWTGRSPSPPAGFEQICPRLHEAGFRTIAP